MSSFSLPHQPTPSLRRLLLFAVVLLFVTGCSHESSSYEFDASEPVFFLETDWFLVIDDAADVTSGGNVITTLRRGESVELLKLGALTDEQLTVAKLPGKIRSQNEPTWRIDSRSVIRSRPLSEVGCLLIPYQAGNAFEIRLSQAVAQRLSDNLTNVNEDLIEEVTNQIVGPLANAAGTAALPQAGQLAGQAAELASQFLVALAKSNFSKFKLEIAAAAMTGDVLILINPPQAPIASSLTFNIVDTFTPAFSGEVQYKYRLHRSLMSINPTMIFDSTCWSVQNVTR